MNFAGLLALVLLLAAPKVEACALFFKTSENGPTSTAGLSIDQTRRKCTARDFNGLVRTAPPSDRNFLKKAIFEYFSKDPKDQWKFQYIQDMKDPEKIYERYSVVTVPDKPGNGPDGPGPGGDDPDTPASLDDFRANFGTDFVPDRIGLSLNITPPVERNIFSDTALGTFVSAGYFMSMVVGSGAARDAAEGLTAAFNAAILGKRAEDPVAAEERARLAAAAVADLQRLMAERQAQYQDSLEAIKGITVMSNTEFEELKGSLEQIAAKLEEMRKLLEEGVKNLNKANSDISKFQGLTKDSLRVSEDEFKKLKSGAIADSALKKTREEIERELAKFTQNKSLNSLEAVQDAARGETNAYRKAQYANLLSSYLNSAGLVRSWAEVRSDLVSDGMKKAASNDKQLAGTVNRALGLAVSSAGGSQGEAIANQMIRSSDLALQYRAKSDPSDKRQGERRLSRARYMYEYEVGSDLAKSMGRYESDGAFKSEFVYSARGDTYSGLQIVSVGNRLAPHIALQGEVFQLHANLAIRGMIASQGDSIAFEAQADNAWALLDFVEGVGTGIGQNLVDTVKGTYQLVRHPLDSAEGIAMAIVNYEQTWDALVTGVADSYDKLANCNKNAAACGEVVGSITADIAQTLVTGGALKGTTVGGRLAQGLEKAGQAVTKRAAELVARGAKLGLDDAGDVERFLKKVGGPCNLVMNRPRSLFPNFGRKFGAVLLAMVSLLDPVAHAAVADPCKPAGTIARAEDAMSASEKLGTSLDEAANSLPSTPKSPRVVWPPNRGFHNPPVKHTLKPGELIDRYGPEGGTFVSPKGVPFEARALPDETLNRGYHVYRVVREFEVDAGIATPWFGKVGMGAQYELPKRVSELLDGPNSFLEEVID